jgi:hypothetical protein
MRPESSPRGSNGGAASDAAGDLARVGPTVGNRGGYGRGATSSRRHHPRRRARRRSRSSGRVHSGGVTGSGSLGSGSLGARSPGEHTQRRSSPVEGSRASSPQAREKGALEHCRSPSTVLQAEYISRHRVPPPMGPSSRAGPLERSAGTSGGGSGGSGEAVAAGGAEREALTGSADETSPSRRSTQAESNERTKTDRMMGRAAPARHSSRNVRREWISIGNGSC